MSILSRRIRPFWLVLALFSNSATPFSVTPVVTAPLRLSAKSDRGRSVPEWGSFDESDFELEEGSGRSLAAAELDGDDSSDHFELESEEGGHQDQSAKIQYASVAPGTVVHIQVGDIGLARKAWKKRRRTGSPLLVPCSILHADRQSTIRWNILYLLEKFGSSTHSGGGIRISMAQLSQRHRSHLKSSLTQHAATLGYESPQALVESLFSKQMQETHGVKLVYYETNARDGNSQMLWIESPLSRTRAHRRAGKAAVLQFQPDPDSEDTIVHTGIVRTKQAPSDEDGNYYNWRPLSAALRVSQKDDVETGKIQNGSKHAAVVFDFDPAGDAGAPLLTLSLNPRSREQRRGSKKQKLLDNQEHQPIHNPKFVPENLAVGQGPITGEVVRFVKGAALVDCGVGRCLNSKKGHGEMIKVLGSLPFRDAVTRHDDLPAAEEGDWDSILSTSELGDDDEETPQEETAMKSFFAALEEIDAEEEDSEDITDMVAVDETGTLIYRDPDTGETQVVERGDEAGMSSSEEMSPPRVSETKQSLRSHRLHIGDQVDVYVKSVAKQSSQLMLTMDASVKGRKAKELKKQGDVTKKLERLAKQLGGLHRLEQLEGQQCDGVVKAVSHAGDWFYVEPRGMDLPVGVASVPAEMQDELDSGDSVRIEIDGIDESRGQLALRVLRKLLP